MIDTLLNGINNITKITVNHRTRSVCAESRWVDYLIPLNALFGDNNAAARLITFKQ